MPDPGAAADRKLRRVSMANLSRMHELATWFEAEFGSTSCRALTQSDFSTKEGFQTYVENDGTRHCRGIAEAVAHGVQELIQERSARTG